RGGGLLRPTNAGRGNKQSAPTRRRPLVAGVATLPALASQSRRFASAFLSIQTAAGGRLLGEGWSKRLARSSPMTAPRTIQFTLNGEAVSATVAPHQNLVELLQQFGLGGARESCAQGLCGCCTVILDGRAVSGCLFLAVFADGARIETVEGLANGEQLDPIQEAFIETGAFQCGFCTPGFVLMTRQLLDENPSPGEDDIRHYLSGNLCRCAAYPQIIEAVQLAARKRHGAMR